jgi:hypothetical protein
MNLNIDNRFRDAVRALGRSVPVWKAAGRNVGVLIFDEKTGRFSTVPDHLEKFCAKVADQDEAAIKDQVKRYKDAYAPGGEAVMRSLNGLRIITINNFMRVMSNWREMFFETQSLGPEDRPAYKHTYQNQVDVYLTGPDGGLRRVKAVKPQKEVYPELYEKKAGPVHYAVRDIQNGFIGPAAQATFDLATDAREVDDLDHYTALQSCFGSFTTSGAKIDRTFQTGRNVRAGVIPTTNELTTPSQGAATKMKWETLREALNYTVRFGTVLGGQRLRLTGIVLVPADELVGITEQFTPTGTTNNSTADRIIADFFSFGWGGINWTLVPDLYLPAGKAIFQTDRKVGHSWEKPSMDMEFVVPSDPQERLRQNREEREYHFVRGISIPGPWKPHVLRVSYHT